MKTLRISCNIYSGGGEDFAVSGFSAAGCTVETFHCICVAQVAIPIV